MKAAIYCLLGVMAIGNQSCKKQGENSRKDTLSINQCKTYEVAPGSATICFEAVEQDSRCPTGVTCVWEGIAVARFKASLSGKNHLLTLATRDFSTYSKDTLLEGITIELLNLSPYPDGFVATRSDSYKATLRVTR